jgi:hypothetical protein
MFSKWNKPSTLKTSRATMLFMCHHWTRRDKRNSLMIMKPDGIVLKKPNIGRLLLAKSWFEIFLQIYVFRVGWQPQVINVMTLSLARDQSKGLEKAWAKSEARESCAQSQECRKVWGNEPTHSQVGSHFWSWSLDGLPSFYKAISRVKTHWIEYIFIPLKSSWNLDV